jgi:hypothetical protein
MLAVHENLNQVDNVYFDFILLFSQPWQKPPEPDDV